MLNVKAGTLGIKRAFKETGKELPVMISGTIEPMGTTLAGQSIESFYISIEHIKPLSVGLNCATGLHSNSYSVLAQKPSSSYSVQILAEHLQVFSSHQTL